ncbi:MAG: isocitrate dehydrogenase (NADP(+)) [Synergistales bacterium]|nr:isocitrate dehydrogenase (NADP(+)) [Synergistales bacterium]
MEQGEKIRIENGQVVVPDTPVIPFIEGDGIGVDITPAAIKVVDAVVAKTYGGTKQIVWKEILAGEKALRECGEVLPRETLDAIREYRVAIKGPLTTPVGGGFRSLNVTIRQTMELFACVRPVKWLKGVPSPVKRPEDVDIVIFRENMEDLYAGIEWPADSPEAADLRNFLKERYDIDIPEDSGLGIKPISRRRTRDIVGLAMEYLLQNGRKRLTIVQKGNVMKYTEGAFKAWAYEYLQEQYGDRIITEEELYDRHDGEIPEGKVLVNDRIADNMFQQMLLRSSEYDIVVTPNLNGDYLSDMTAAQVGGLGMAPGANMGRTMAVFEATHGSAPKHAGMNRANPSSLLFSARMMLDFLGWNEAADALERAVETTIGRKTVTYDLARQLEGATRLSTSAFADAIVANIDNT